MASQIPPIEVKLIADVQELKAGLQKAEQQIDGLKGSTAGASDGMNKLEQGMSKLKMAGIAAAAAVGALAVKMAVDAVKGAIEEQAAQERLATVLANVTGLTREQSMAIDAQLEKMALASGVADDQLRPAYSKLVTATKDTAEAQRLLKIAMDVSAATGKPLEAVTSSLSRAYAGNTAGLSRLGVGLGAAEIKALGLKGSVDKLAKTFEGASERQANTLEFRIKRLKMAFSETAEDIATAVLPIIEKLMEFINNTAVPAFQKLRDMIAGDKGGLNSKFKEIGDYVKKFVTPIIEAMRGAFEKVKAAILDNKENFMKYLTILREIVAWAMKYLVPLFREFLVGAVKYFGFVASTTIRALGPLVRFVAESVKTLLNGVIDVVNGFIKTYNVINVLFGTKDIPLLDKIGESSSKASKELKEVGKVAEETKKKTKDAFGAGAGGGGGGGASATDTKAQAAIKKLRDEMEKTYTEIEKVQREAQDDRLKAEEDYEEKSLEILEKYNEAKAEIAVRYQERLDEAQERFDEAKADALKTRQKAEESAQKRHADNLIRIAADYADKEKEIKTTLNKKLADLEANYQLKQTELRRNAEEKRLSIMQTSMDRLRSAFAARTGFDLAESFKTNKSAEALLTDLKNKLDAAQKLQKNAAVLAGMGYSQTFIEQVVKEGPEAGNAIAEALKEASPQATRELQSLYAQIETVSATGLDSLAQTLNASGNLATRELRAAYAQLAIDLQADLKKLNADLLAATAEANADYNAAIAKAKADRDKASAESFAALTEALDEAKAAYDEAIAEAEAALDKARLKAEEERTKQLAAAKAAYDKAIEDAQKALEKSLDDIQINMLKKLAELRAEIAKTAAEMAALGGKPFVPTGGVQSDFAIMMASKTSEQVKAAAQGSANKVVGDTNIVVNGFDLSDPNATAQSLVSIAKYGQTITVLSKDASQMQTTGIGAARAGIVRVAE